MSSPKRSATEPSSPSHDIAEIGNFLQLLREYLTAHAELGAIFAQYTDDKIPFAAIRVLVGDDDRSVLYRLKEKSHALFRSHGIATKAVRREALFDLAVGSLFHETMKRVLNGEDPKPLPMAHPGDWQVPAQQSQGQSQSAGQAPAQPQRQRRDPSQSILNELLNIFGSN